MFNGFAVTVCDPREEYRSTWSVPGVVVLPGKPDDVVTAFGPDCRSAVVALTHDPKLDDLALLEALSTQAFYIGAIGSRRNNEARRHRMMAHFGASAQSLARLRGPIGIYIGSKVPAEIAVIVLASGRGERFAASGGRHTNCRRFWMAKQCSSARWTPWLAVAWTGTWWTRGTRVWATPLPPACGQRRSPMGG